MSLNIVKKEKLCQLIRSHEQAVYTVRVLEEAHTLFYKGGVGQSMSYLKNNLPEDVFAFLNYHENLETFLEDTTFYLRNVKIAHIAVPIRPSGSLIDKIYKWFSENVTSEVFMDISTDSNIWGGVRMTYMGLYFDGSINREVEDFFRNK